MDEELITKKELLEQTGISYGALYRWKRLHLLPDDWFIHRSTFTGHETFFPREKVLARVEEIQALKQTMSLEEIARHFSPVPAGELSLTPGEAGALGIAPPPILNRFLIERPMEHLDFRALLELYAFPRLLQEGTLSREEALEMAAAAADTGELSQPVVYLYRKYGVAFCVTAGEMQKIQPDRQAVQAAVLNVSQLRAALTGLLKEKGVSV